MFNNAVLISTFTAKLKCKRWALLAICTLCAPVLASTAPVSKDDGIARQLVEHLKPLVSIMGAFEQHQTGSEGELLSQSSGTFKMQRPGMLRWQTVEPFPQLLVTDGADIWMYDPDLEQVTISKVASQLMNTPAVIFSGNLEELQKQYHVTSREEDHYRLRPIQSGNSFQRLDLAFANGVLSEMVILDSFGQLTAFQLKDVKPSAAIAVSEFQFIPPEGTDVFFNE